MLHFVFSPCSSCSLIEVSALEIQIWQEMLNKQTHKQQGVDKYEHILNS